MPKKWFENKKLMIWSNSKYLVFGITRSDGANIYSEKEVTISLFIIHFTFYIKNRF